MAHKFRPEKAARLHAPERDRLQPWQPLLDLLPLGRLTAVADLGAGTGYFAIPLARQLAGLKRAAAGLGGAVAARGRVYALDVQREMLGFLRERLQGAGVENLDIIQVGEPELPFAEAFLDAMLLVNMLHEFADLPASLRELQRILRPGGMLVVSDWKKVATEEGPPLEERISEEEAIDACRAAGFTQLTVHPLYREHYTITGQRG